MPTADEALQELLRNRPDLHFTDAGAQDWTLGDEALRWLGATLKPSWRTLETGCGASSIVFMLSGAEHTIVAPHAPEHELARKWCEQRGFPTQRTTSIVDGSGQALPHLDHALDLALIDGAHAFPTPFIDWYYIAHKLHIGGWLLIDDIQLAPCRLLDEFLRAERDRWRHVRVIGGKTSVFQKTGEPVIPERDWQDQPWVVVANRTRSPTLQRARLALRPRTRLKAALAAPRARRHQR